MTRIIAISDTHLNQDFSIVSEKFINNILKTADLVVHCGDFTSLQVYQFLSEITGLDKFKAVRGNMDRREVKDHLPEINSFTVMNRRIGIIHGWGGPQGLASSIYTKLRDLQFDIVFFDHSHVPYNRVINDTLFINPGAFKSNNGLQYAVVTIDDSVSVELCSYKMDL